MISPSRIRWRSASAATALALVLATGCSDEGTLTADQFVEQMNAAGADLERGDELPSLRPDAELFAIELHEQEAEAADDEHPHGGGTLTVMPGEEEALEEFERCERAVSLLCFRAGNVVVFFEDGLAPEAQGRIAAALQELAAE